MSLLNVPSTPFPPTFSSLAASLMPHTGIRVSPCVTLLGDELSGHLGDSMPITGHEPKFCIDVSSEHTPINLPNRNMSFQQEYDATITASFIYLDIQERQAAASTWQQTEFPLC